MPWRKKLMTLSKGSRALLRLLMPLVAAGGPVLAHQPHDALLLIATSPNFSNDRTIIAASDYLSVSIGVFAPWRSTDGGVTWWVMRDLPNVPINSVDFSPNYAADRTIYIAGKEGLFRSTDGGDSWTGIGPAPGSPVTDLALSPAFAADQTLLAITASNQCWRSTNRGTTWTQVAAPAATLTRIVFNPHYPVEKAVLLGTAANGLFRSTNLGGSWSALTGAWRKVTQILYSPGFVTDRTLWVTTMGGGVFRSTQAGLNFAQVNSGLTNVHVNSIAVSPTYSTDSTLFVATTTGVFTSTTSGTSWSPAAAVQRELSTQTASHYRSLATGRTGNVNYLFVAMFEGLWMSTTSGAAWSDLDMIPAYLIRKISASATYAQDHTLFATCYGGGALWTSDGAQTWTYKNVGLANSYPDGNSISPAFNTDGKAFLGNGAGMQLFANGTWGQTTNLGGKTYVRALAASPNYAVDKTVFMGTDNIDTGNPVTVVWQGQTILNQGVFKSTDGGVSFAPTGLAGPRISGIVPSPNFANDRVVFASSPDNGLFKSSDGGNTWSNIVVNPADMAILEVEVSPGYAQDGTVLAATSRSGIFKSADDGATWTRIPGSDLLTGLNMAFSPAYASDNTIFFGTMQQGLLKSPDGGQTVVPTGLPNAFVMNVVLSPNYQGDQTLFATTYQGVYKSTDGGTTWAYTFNPARMEQDREGNIWNTNGTPVRIASPSASTGAVNSFTTPGATANITFVGSSVRVLTATGPAQGDVAITLDGVNQGTVSLRSATQQSQVQSWQQSNLPCALHTLTLTAATSGAGKTGMLLDAVDYGRETCPF